MAFLLGSSALEWIPLPDTLRAGVLPRWYGVALAASVTVSLPLALYGTALFGLVLVILGLALWSRKVATSGQRPRVA